ncbi:SCO family protein [Alsobacter sp. R-9]
MSLRTLRVTLWALVAVALAGAGVLWFWPGPTAPGTPLGPGVSLVKPYTMTDHRGRAVDERSYLGKPTAWFFGFTHCPDVCPTTLMTMTTLLKDLGADADRLTVVFVTVDPERDTPQVLAEYLTAFDPRIIALSGSPEQLAAMAKTFYVTYRKQPLEGGGYTMDHSATVLLADKDGRLVGTLDPHDTPAAIASKARRLVQRGEP